MKHTTHSEQELREKIHQIMELSKQNKAQDGYSDAQSWCEDKMFQLIQSEREKVIEEIKTIPTYMIKSRNESVSDDEFGFIRVVRLNDVLAKLAQKEESK